MQDNNYSRSQENPAFQGGDELISDMSSSLRGNPALLARGGRHQTSKYPTVIIFGEKNPFSFRLSKLLNAKSLNVLFAGEANADETIFDFAIVLPETQEKLFDSAISLAKINKAKALFIFNYSQPSKEEESVENRIQKIEDDGELFAGIFLIGDFLYPEDAFSNFLKIDFSDKSIIFQNKDFIYFCDIDALLENIVKGLFSLSAYGNKTALLGRPIKLLDFVTSAQKALPNYKTQFLE